MDTEEEKSLDYYFERQYIYMSEAIKAAGYRDPASFLRLAAAGKIPALKVQNRWIVPILWAERLKTDPPRKGRPRVSIEHKRAVRARLERERRRRLKAKKEAEAQQREADDRQGTPAEPV